MLRGNGIFRIMDVDVNTIYPSSHLGLYCLSGHGLIPVDQRQTRGPGQVASVGRVLAGKAQ